MFYESLKIDWMRGANDNRLVNDNEWSTEYQIPPLSPLKNKLQKQSNALCPPNRTSKVKGSAKGTSAHSLARVGLYRCRREHMLGTNGEGRLNRPPGLLATPCLFVHLVHLRVHYPSFVRYTSSRILKYSCVYIPLSSPPHPYSITMMTRLGTMHAPLLTLPDAF
jgi:hypothetical protein